MTEVTASSGPSERITEAFKTLRTSARKINEVSGELAKPIASIERALKRLNLGVACWTTISSTRDLDGLHFKNHDVGYAYSRALRRWCLAIRTVEGREGMPESDYEETWPFSDAPRFLRIKAVNKLPELIEALVDVTDATANRLKKQVEPAQQLAAAVNELINPKDK